MNFKQRFIVPLIFILLIPVTAYGDLPDMENCSIATRATEDVSVFICPACDGYTFSQAQKFGGDIMDATIEVYIRTGTGEPVANVSAQDIWIDDPNICWSLGGGAANSDTDENGYTQFALPPCGGGCSPNFELGGYLAGNAFLQNPLPHIKLNSVDLNCDLVVNLTDLAMFAGAYFGAVTYCADYYWDGAMNLLDLALFSQHYGHHYHN